MSTLKTKNCLFLFFLHYLCDTIILVIYMFNILGMCDDYILGNFIDIIKRAINLLGLIVPILLVVGATISIVKGVLNPEDKTVMKKVLNSFLSAIIVLFLPYIINTTMRILATANKNSTTKFGINENGKTNTFSFAVCWSNIRTTNVNPTKNKDSSYEENDKIAEEQEKNKYISKWNTAKKAWKAVLEEEKKKKEEEEKKNNNNSNNNNNTNVSSSTYNEVVLIGDSRFVHQSSWAPGNSKTTYIAESNKGLDYVKQQINNIKKHDSKDSAFVINMGVNDYWKNNIVSEYTKYLNELADSMKGKLYFLSVNPVDEAKEKSSKQAYFTSNANIDKFNESVKKGLNSKITYLDSNSYLKANGFSTQTDGIHYDEPTSKKIYNYITQYVKS